MFITFEGIEGAGKGTVLAAVKKWLDTKAIPYIMTREPGGSELGRQLRAILLDTRQQVVPEAELFLYLADRAQHVREIILPALKQGKVVLSDRYADSTIVYKGYGRGLDVAELYQMNDKAVGGVWPDITFLLDVDPDVGLTRARKRNAELGIDVIEGRFEAEKMQFHERIRNGYLAWAKEHAARFCLIDGGAPPEITAECVLKVLSERVS